MRPQVSETDPRDVIKIKETVAETLEQKVARLEAKLGVIDLLARYAAYVQIGDGPAVWNLYTDDCEYILGGTVDLRVQGKENLLRYLATHKGFRRKADGKTVWRGSDTKFRHLMSLPVIRVSEDCKEAWVTMHFSGVITRFTGVHSDKTSHEGTYIHHCVKQGDEWKFRRFVNNTELAHDPLYHVVED